MDKYEREIIETWREQTSRNYNYFEEVETEASTLPFWDAKLTFRQMFDKLDLTNLCEIACGQGRHTVRVPDSYQTFIAVDTSPDAVAVARQRVGSEKVRICLSEDGSSIPCEDNAVSAIFSYDAMVHFEPLTIGLYMREAARVLRLGGRALFHHSVFDQNPTGKFTDSPNWRNYMTKDLIRHFASRAGFDILQQEIFEWNNVPESDALTLFEKTK